MQCNTVDTSNPLKTLQETCFNIESLNPKPKLLTLNLQRKKSQRIKRGCVFDLGAQNPFATCTNVPIESKIKTLNYLNRKLNEDPVNYYKMHTNMVIENLIQSYPNYLDQFKKIVDKTGPE